MSAVTASFMEFAAKVNRSNDLMRQVTTITPGDAAAIQTLAKSQGYNFSMADLEAIVRENSTLANGADDELSEDQLDNVSGGLVVNNVIAILIMLMMPSIQKERSKK